MSGEVISRGHDKEESVVEVGHGRKIGMQLVQDLYNEITGKKETVARAFSVNHQATLEDIKQLNTKIVQLYEQYNIVSQTCSVTLYHVDDCKEQFSSFERFEFYDKGSLSPVENIRLEYNFLIVLPKTNRPQPYKITIDIHSRSALRQRAEREHGLPRKVLKIFAARTGNVEISYVDYTVARNFLVAVEQWIESLKTTSDGAFIEKLQDTSEHFPFLFRFLTTIVSVATIYAAAGRLLGEPATLEGIFTAGVLAFGGIFALSQLGFKLGMLVEREVDAYQTISALRLNRGDELAASAQQSSNRSSAFKAIGATVSMVMANVFSAWLAFKIGVGA